MSKITRLVIASGLVCMIFAGSIGSSRVSAQGVPDSFACYDIEPLGLLELLNIVDELEQVSSSGGAVVVSVWGPSLAGGTDISFTERTQIAALLESFVACINQQDAMRIFSVLSGRYQALLVMDLLGNGNAIAAMAEQIPVILDAPDASDPLTTPVIIEAWRQFPESDNIWSVVSMKVPGFTENVSFFVAFSPGGTGWEIAEIAVFEE